MAKARAIDAVALYEQIAAEVSSMLKQPPGIIVSKIMAMVLQAPTIGSSEAKEDVPDDRFDALAAPWPRKLQELTGLRNTRFGMEPVEIARPPQSWGYVRELEEVRNEQEGE